LEARKQTNITTLQFHYLRQVSSLNNLGRIMWGAGNKMILSTD